MKVKGSIYVSVLLTILLLVSCGKDEIDNAEVRFRMLYDGNPLIMFENVTYPDGKIMYFTRISLFIENLTLKGNEDMILVDRDYLTLSDNHLSAEEANLGTLVYSAAIKEDAYNIGFNIGVAPQFNAMVPADFPSSDVLSNPAEYWPGWTSYVFAKVEGFIDLDGDGDTETGFALHIGSDGAYRNVLTSEILEFNDRGHLILDIDLENLFLANGVLYDIEANPQIHSPEQNPLVQILADNFVACFQ